VNNITPQEAIAFAKTGHLFFGKFVKTEKGYYLGDADLSSHAKLFPDGEKPISAGFVGIYSGGEMFSLRNDRSSTLNLGRDENDLQGLTEFLGISGTQAD